MNSTIINKDKNMRDKTYSELIKRITFLDRLEYLMLYGIPGDTTFGINRELNQAFYASTDWALIRREIMLRDHGCDLGIKDMPIRGKVYVHHINPLTTAVLMHSYDEAIDPNNLITVSFQTHNIIHYAQRVPVIEDPAERRPGDTKLW